MNRIEAADYADKAAAAVMDNFKSLADRFGVSVDRLAAFVEAADGAPAEALYIFGCREGKRAAPEIVPYASAERQFAVACEIFRATYLALLVLVREADARDAEARRAASGDNAARFGKRTFDKRRRGLSGRVAFPSQVVAEVKAAPEPVKKKK